VFAKAREKARQSSCLSNTKQIILGVMQYAQDYDEILPYASSWTWGDGTVRYWWQYLDPYMKNTQLMQCPSYRGVTQGYGWNYQNFGYRSSAGTYYNSPGRSLGAIVVPAETFLLGDNPDSGLYGAGGIYIYGPTQYIPDGSTATDDPALANVAKRHNGGGNYGFCDGHSKWVSGSDATGKDRLWTVAED